MKNLMMLFALNRGYKASMPLKIISMVFIILCAVAIVIAGVITGEALWLWLGLIWTIMFVIALVILIICNIRRNTTRW